MAEHKISFIIRTGGSSITISCSDSICDECIAAIGLYSDLGIEAIRVDKPIKLGTYSMKFNTDNTEEPWIDVIC